MFICSVRPPHFEKQRSDEKQNAGQICYHKNLSLQKRLVYFGMRFSLQIFVSISLIPSVIWVD